MRKTLKLKLLSSIFFISTFESCSSKKDQNPESENLDTKCYCAVRNMVTFLKENLDSNNLQNLCNRKFADIFVDALAVRNESEKHKDSVDNSLKRLFQTKSSEENFNIVGDLKTISDKINNEPISMKNSLDKELPKMLFMGNSNCKEHFSILGKSFKSEGVEYALIIFNDRVSKIFLSDSSSVNNFLIDQQGNILDRKRWQASMSSLGNNIQCIVIPILHLELKPRSYFIHLGGFNWDTPHALSMFFSLIGAQIYALKNEQPKQSQPQEYEIEEVSERKIYLYVNEEDQGAWTDGNVGFSNFLQSCKTARNYKNILDGVFSFIAHGINYIRYGNEYHVFSLTPYAGHFAVDNKPYKFEDLINDIQGVQDSFPSVQSVEEDIFCNVFSLLKSKVADKQTKQNEIETLEKQENPTADDKEKLVQAKEALKKIPHLEDESLDFVRLFVTKDGKQKIKWEDKGTFTMRVNTYEKHRSFEAFYFFEGNK